MTDHDEPAWTLSQHIRAGRIAIDLLTEANAGNEPICHHFDAADGVDVDRLLMEDGYAEAVYGPVVPIFKNLGLDFQLYGLEAWEKETPTLRWLDERVPSMVRLAARYRLTYNGWTWEPIEGQPIGACTFSVINNR